MFGPFRKRPPIRILRLFALQDGDGNQIDRHALKAAVFDGCRLALGSLPEQFDIDGPYGIPKGRTIGRQAFESRLESKGHDAYTGYSGGIGRESGFNVVFFDAPPYPLRFCEIVLWQSSISRRIDAAAFIRQVATAATIDYGYEVELPGDCSPTSENPVKSGFFGTSTVVGGKLAEWRQSIDKVHAGEVRAIYPLNFLNRRQLERLKASAFEKNEVVGGLYEVRPQETVSHAT